MGYDIGPKIGVDGEAQFRQSIIALNAQLKSMGAEMRAVTSAYDAGDKSTEALTSRNEVLGRTMAATKQKIAMLQEQYDKQRSKLTELGSALDAATEQFGENSSEAIKVQNAYNAQATQLNRLAQQLHTATASLNDMERELNANDEALSKQGYSLDNLKEKLSGLGQKVGAAMATAMKSIAVATAAAGTAVVALGKQSISAYADYEQLVGGVETLFKDSASLVGGYADNAYKTAGLSANAYMETVTSFSASLLSSLDGDTAAAASAANTAITDMADNANKMGTSMEAVQYAYQGFAKQNYTMLDNLKLGYGGTKTEMERLLADAEAISGLRYDISSLNDVYEAIHVIQGEIGITGTTAKESSTTIQGSAASMAAAWQNMLVGLSDGSQNIDQLLKNLLDSVGTFGENLLPRIEVTLGGIAELVTKLVPQIAERLPVLASDLLPKITGIGLSLVQGLLGGLTDNFSQLSAGAVGMVASLASGIVELLPELAKTASTLVSDLAGYVIENVPQLIPAAVEMVSGLVQSLTENLSSVLGMGIEMVAALLDGLIQALPELITYVPEIVSNIANVINDNAPKLLTAAAQLILKLAVGLVESIPVILANLPQIIGAIVDTLMAFNWINLGGNLIKAIADGLKGALGLVKTSAGELQNTILTGIQGLPATMKTIGKNIVEGLLNGFKNSWGWLKNQVNGLIGGFVGSIKTLLGIRSPSRVFAGIGEYMAQGLGEGFGDQMKSVARSMEDAIPIPTVGHGGGTGSPIGGSPTGNDGSGFGRELAGALREAMGGMAVYMDGKQVGVLVSRRQSNTVRATGGSPALA